MDVLLGALKSKTIWFNLIGLVAIVLGSEQIKAFISPEHLLMIQAIVNLILRVATTESLAIKGV
jgi:hypothetical protein